MVFFEKNVFSDKGQFLQYALSYTYTYVYVYFIVILLLYWGIFVPNALLSFF